MNWRTPFALAVSPIIPAACVAFGMEALSVVEWQYWRAWSFFVLVLEVAEAAAFVIAYPAYLLVSRRRAVGMRESLVAGFLIGCLMGVLGVIVGLSSAWIFWALAIRGRTGGSDRPEPLHA
ncbi:hypothetical protein O4H66_28380 [Comamonadaceae bacterium G21597-S1]|nr:hypothetical protein [Comamonadaceae bacterium G21597-S1]